jgi:Domain of unknown function (DUF4352)
MSVMYGNQGRKDLVGFAVILLGILLVGCQSPRESTGQDSPAAQQSAPAAPPPSPSQPVGTIGKPVRVGDTEFTVRRMRCGATTIKADSVGMLGWKATGEYCQLPIAVKNVGKTPVLFRPGKQLGYSADGSQYSSKWLVGWPDQEHLDDDIGPGFEVTGELVFDVPTDRELVKLELHEGDRATTVAVQLR